MFFIVCDRALDYVLTLIGSCIVYMHHSPLLLLMLKYNSHFYIQRMVEGCYWLVTHWNGSTVQTVSRTSCTRYSKISIIFVVRQQYATAKPYFQSAIGWVVLCDLFLIAEWMSRLLSEETVCCYGRGSRTCWRLEAFQAWSGLTKTRWCSKFHGNTVVRKTGHCVTAAFSWYVISPYATLLCALVMTMRVPSCFNEFLCHASI